MAQVSQNAATESGTGRPGLTEFFELLLAALDREEVRHRLVVREIGLAEEREGAAHIVLAIHPRDVRKLTTVLRPLSDRCYLPVQRWSSSANRCTFVFAWFQGLVLKSVLVEFLSEPCMSWLFWESRRLAPAGNRKGDHGRLADLSAEFACLLVWAISTDNLGDSAGERLKTLLNTLGRPRAERIAARFVGRGRARRVVRACLNSTLSEMAHELRFVIGRRQLLRNPFRVVGRSLSRTWQRVQSWMQPAGLSFILLGPDGVGKSTLVAGLLESLGAAFRGHQLFHWRPGVVVPIRDGDDSLSSPHEEPPRSAALSVLYLFGFFADFCVGYAVRIRPFLVRSGLVVFDRYFHDLLVDQKRYRYAGPMWLARLLLRLSPGHNDLLLVLDAPEDVIASRKQQLSREELSRQRAAYRALCRTLPNAYIVETQHGIEPTLAAAAQIIVGHLAQRFVPQSSASVELNPRHVSADSL